MPQLSSKIADDELRRQIQDAARRVSGDPLNALWIVANAMAQSSPPSNDIREIKRRANILSAKSRMPGTVNHVCAFCGKTKSERDLAAHLRRQHGAELLTLPPEKFN